MDYNGYSAKVSLSLFIGGVALSLSHVGPSGFIVSDKCEPHAAGRAELVIRVGERESKSDVFLPYGIPGAGQLIRFI